MTNSSSSCRHSPLPRATRRPGTASSARAASCSTHTTRSSLAGLRARWQIDAAPRLRSEGWLRRPAELHRERGRGSAQVDQRSPSWASRSAAWRCVARSPARHAAALPPRRSRGRRSGESVCRSCSAQACRTGAEPGALDLARPDHHPADRGAGALGAARAARVPAVLQRPARLGGRRRADRGPQRARRPPRAARLRQGEREKKQRVPLKAPTISALERWQPERAQIAGVAPAADAPGGLRADRSPRPASSAHTALGPRWSRSRSSQG